jgi:hypothetical protein
VSLFEGGKPRENKMSVRSCCFASCREAREWLAAFAFAAMASLAAGFASAAEGSAPSELPVKASFLYKFLDYVEWPPGVDSVDAPIVIGVWGPEVLAEEVSRLVAGEKQSGRPVSVIQVREIDALAGMRVLFIARDETGIAGITRVARQKNILTVTEVPGGLSQGSVVNFVSSEGRVRFEISLDAAEKSGLKISSRLLGLAKNVVGP